MTNSRTRFVILLLAILLISTFSFAATARKVNFSNLGNKVSLVNNNDFGFELQFKLQDFSLEELDTKAGKFDQLSIEGFGYSGRIGEPKLPVFSKLIAVPLGADVQVEYLNKNQLDISKVDNQLRNRIMPAQPSVSKSANPDMIPFELDSSAYAKDGYTNSDIFKVEEVGILRGVRVFRFDFEPIQYNPKTGDLRVCSNADIRVKFVNPDLARTANLMAKTGSVEFDALYGKLLYNWRDGERLNVNRYPTKMLILCPPAYTSTLQPFVDWKIQQGYNVVVTTVGTGGTVANTTAAINTYMAGVWSAATAQDPAPTYLLIVGDTSTSGNNIIANTGSAGSHVTDLNYVRLQGTDYLPEMYYGRFSVSSTTELTNIVNKSVTFQKTAMPDLSYLGKAVMIAGVDASYAPTYGNGAINYGTTHYFNTGNGITSDTYLYPASGSSDAQIIANANEGRGYMNYTAHGSETSWADPTFTVSDVNAMTNTAKYGVMVGNCCVTNAFGTSVCFGESIIRKANAGGVNYIGGTNNTYWDEDYWWGIGYKTPIQATAHAYSASTLGAYDAMFHSHGEAFSNWATTVGEINIMGNSAVEQSTSSRKPYYWEIYSIMGDPSTMPYLGVPTVNTATFPSTILIGATSITVTAAPYSRVALSMGGVLYGTDLVPSGGSLTLPITPFSNVGTAQLVITANQKITRIENITIAPNSGPYMTVDANTYNDANNSVAEYNEQGRFSTTFKNVGSQAVSNVTATLTCSTPGISIVDGTETIASLAAGASVARSNAFSFNVANNIVNQLSASFTITMVSGANTWEHSFTQLFNAPALAFGNMMVSDPTGNNNNRLDPGETVTITMPLNNMGAAASPSGSATLSSPTSGITINTGTANYSSIVAGGTTNLSFSITASAGMSIGQVANLAFATTAGAYTASKNETTTVGIIIEDFETGNFNAFPWVQSTIPWTIDNSGAYAGTYAARSGVITASGNTSMQTTRVLTSSGTLSFYYKVSSESGYDFLKFSIDGVQQNQWSGTVDWTQATYTLAAGTRVLKWEYTKDTSVDSGSDCAWVDNIVFPASTVPSSFNPPTNFAVTASHAVANLSWSAPTSGTPTGYKIYKNSSLLTTITGLSYSDTAVSNGTSYSYYVKAAYSGGDSDATNTISVTPNAVAPTNLTATPGNGLVVLSWTAATGRGMDDSIDSKDNRAISGYRVYRNGSSIANVSVANYTDTGLSNGTSYSYYVTTVYANPAGESAASNTVSATPDVVMEAIIGNGTAVTGTQAGSPVNVYYKSLHGQSIYTMADLNNAGVFGPIYITQLGFNITGLPTRAMPNFIVRMKHTAQADVSSAWVTVDETNVVYSNASYLPTVTGYNMYTLNSPFLWNGTDNIVIDTAFGVFSEAYASTGQVEYTTVTGGYRFGRSDTVDQTNLFTGTSTATTRPNVKLILAPATTNPQISVSPTTLSYGSVAVGTSSTQNITITNVGGGTLSGTITTPTGYNVVARSSNDKATLNFSLGEGESRAYNISFAPTAATSYNANVVISSNSETLGTINVAVTGTGYIPPTMVVDAETIAAALMQGEEGSDSFSISNTGSQSLNYSIGLSEVRNRAELTSKTAHKVSLGKNITGSTLVLDTELFIPGASQDWTFTATNASPDSDWMKYVIIEFPAGVIVNSATNFVGGDGGEMAPDVTSGTGVTITWFGETSSNWGVIYGNGDTAVATVNVSVPAGYGSTMNIPYTLTGDGYGEDPHTLEGSIALEADAPPVSWVSVSPLSGTIAGGGVATITADFSAVGMEAGLYEALLSITSNDPVNPLQTVQVLMEVFAGNRPPQITLPESFTFEKNGSLTQSFASYISDPDADPLTLSYTCSSNITVDISGSSVTIGAAENYVGTETVTFTVSDGEFFIHDNVDVIVTPTEMPTWEPVVYPTNPATVYAVVTIDGIPAQLNDMVAAFVGDECRATGEIVMIDRAVAHTTLVVNLAASGETVSFKIYSYSTDTIYPVQEEMAMNTGVVYGETEPVPLNGTMDLFIASPAVAIQSTEGGARLSWNAVTHANSYRIYTCNEPYGEYTYIGSTDSLIWDITPTADKMFFKVIAEKIIPTKASK